MLIAGKRLFCLDLGDLTARFPQDVFEASEASSVSNATETHEYERRSFGYHSLRMRICDQAARNAKFQDQFVLLQLPTPVTEFSKM